MPAKRKAKRIDRMWCTVIVRRCECSAGTNYALEWAGAHSAYIHVFGTLTQPLKGISDVHVQIGVDDKEDGKAVGGVTGIKPLVQVVLGLVPHQFERLWHMALSGRCQTLTLNISPPVRGSATVHSWNASTALDDIW